MGLFLAVFSGCNQQLSSAVVTPVKYAVCQVLNISHCCCVVGERTGKTRQKKKNVREEQIGEKERVAEAKRGREQTRLQMSVNSPQCIHKAVWAERAMQPRGDNKWRRTIRHGCIITDTTDTISLVSFILIPIQLQQMSNLLHSLALMRHNAGNISSILLPAGSISTI